MKVKGSAQRTRTPCAPIAVTAKGLHGRAIAGKGKAAAPDRLQADPLVSLPEEFWEALQDPWGLVLKAGRVPQQWLEVRTVSIPQKEGGDRPLSVEALFWRLGISLITSQLGEWMDGWTPRNIAGAVRFRSAEPLHDRFVQDMLEKTKEGIAGVKLDMAKAFDTVRTDDANFLLTELGAPGEVIRLLEDYDLRHRKWVEHGGAVARRPICPTRGLPQGDPASPLRPTAIMASWIALLRNELGNNGGAAYLDDRLVWECGKGRAPRRQKVLELSAKWEKLYAFEDNAKRRLLFDSILVGRRALQKRFPTGKVDEEVTMLGIRYRFDGEGVMMNTTAAMEKAHRRLGRIAVVGGALQRKQGLVGQLVMPIFSWCSGRMGLSPADRKLLEKDIERAVMGKELVGRNRFLMWTVILGHRISPLFAEMVGALRVAAARQREWLEGRWTVPPFAGRVVEEVLEMMGWRRDPLQADVVQAPEGPVHLGWESEAAVEQLVIKAWQQKLLVEGARLGQDSRTFAPIIWSWSFGDLPRRLVRALPEQTE